VRADVSRLRSPACGPARCTLPEAGDDVPAGGSASVPVVQASVEGLRVLVVGDSFSLPNGQGASARVRAVARGLSAAGCRVRILITNPSERTPQRSLNRTATGVVDGIPFQYTSGSPFWSESFWGRRAAEAKGLLGACVVVARGCDAVVVYTTTSTFLPVALGLSARLRGAVVVKDASELPFVYSRSTALRRRFQQYQVAIVQRVYDGTIVISAYLDDYFRRLSRPGSSTLLVPILVDVAEFERAAAAITPTPNMILFAGNLDHVGEVERLLRVFVPLHARHPATRLTILGEDYGTGRRVELEHTAEALGVADSVDFAGLVSRHDMPTRLAGASVLVLPRAAGAFSTAGLPTKLAEYLATGRPVVVAAVGDIPAYLRDGLDAYVIPPDDETAFQSALERVIEYPSEAAAVGRQGQQCAQRHFDYRLHGRRIAGFLAGVRACRRSS
jgi:glycosyltransferase involved in cell wall biosynthesis